MTIKDLTAKTVKIKSPFFGMEDGIDIDIFNLPFTLIYGQNGSGKSTIAEAFRVAAMAKQENYAENADELSDVAEEYEASTKSDVELSIDDDPGCLAGERVFVFDEKFINDKIVIAEDEDLGNIITVGEQMIEDKKEEDRLKESIEAAKEITSTYKAKSRSLNEERLLLYDKIYNHVYENYERQAIAITGRGRRDKQDTSEITDYIINSILGKQKEVEIDEAKLNRKISEVKDMWDLKTISDPIIPYELTNAISLSNDIFKLLETSIQNPNLTERDKAIIELMSGNDFIGLAKDTIIRHNALYCPLCQREMDYEDRTRLSKNIYRIEQELNRVAEKFINDLAKSVNVVETFEEVINKALHNEDANFLKVMERYANERLEFNQNAHALLNALTEIKDLLTRRQRIDMIYSMPEPLDRERYVSLIENFFKSADILQEKIDLHNKICEEYTSRKTTLLSQCKMLAFNQNKQSILEYHEKVSAMNKLDDDFIEAKKNLPEYKKKLRKILKGGSDYDAAINFINKALHYIFMDKNRLRLRISDKDNFHCTLLSRGKVVPPCKVSIGERNAIALAYYFAESFAGLRNADRYTEQTLYVIDDPISSMDSANRAGILTFLKNQFFEIMNGNHFSKIILLSHDLTTVNDIADIVGELGKQTSYEPEIKEKLRKQAFLEIKDKAIHERKALSSSYESLINEVYEFTKSGATLGEDGIGNKMRRFMESYSSFIYNMGVEDMLRNEVILSSMPAEYRNFYRSSANMFLLDKNSHAESRKDELVTGKIEDQTDDLIKAGKKLLLFIFLTNKAHLQCMLRDEELEIIESWIEDILVEDIDGEERHQKSLDTIAKSYVGKIYLLEKDKYGNYHCGACQLPKRTIDQLLGQRFAGVQIELQEVVRNTSHHSPYQLFCTKFRIHNVAQNVI